MDGNLSNVAPFYPPFYPQRDGQHVTIILEVDLINQ
jgi:hypothetical protein